MTLITKTDNNIDLIIAKVTLDLRLLQVLTAALQLVSHNKLVTSCCKMMLLLGVMHLNSAELKYLFL